jgi:hypothetical protein
MVRGQAVGGERERRERERERERERGWSKGKINKARKTEGMCRCICNGHDEGGRVDTGDRVRHITHAVSREVPKMLKMVWSGIVLTIRGRENERARTRGPDTERARKRESARATERGWT